MRTGLPLLIGLLCAGCQTAKGIDSMADEPPDDPPNCKSIGDGKNIVACRILVNVTEAGGKCRIKFVDPLQDDVLFELGQKNLWIVWRLTPASANYRFLDRTGIVFKDDPLRNFKPRIAVSNGSRFAARNQNSMAYGYGDYNYVINIERRDGSGRCELDPLVRNR